MSETSQIIACLKRDDERLLRRVLATNGGGVEYLAVGGFRLVPLTQINRLLRHGLVRYKPGHAGFVIHTDLTRKVLAHLDALVKEAA